MEHRAINTAENRQRLGERTFWAVAALLVFFTYSIVFFLTGSSGVTESAKSSLRNLAPLVLLTLAVRPLLTGVVARLRPMAALGAHIVLAGAFSFLWYWLLMVLIGLSLGDTFTEFAVRAFFPGPAVAWQLLQGITVYALVAALTYLRAEPELPSFVVAAGPERSGNTDQSLSRYFIRQGEDIHPLDVSQIVSITGADDYAEVATVAGRHLVRMTLADFEKALEGGSFIRVHRSRIVNVDRIIRAEPAGGGRMLLHMENGEMIQASRAGTKLLRDRVI
jgi:two-component system, LytTR family, response regulator